MASFDPRVAFVEGVLDQVEGEIPRELWNDERHTKGLTEWRARCVAGLLANWSEFQAKDKPYGLDNSRMRIYCLGVARGMERS